MNHANSRIQRIKRRGEIDFLTVNQDVSAVSAGFPDHIHTEKELHQRTLASSVFAYKAQYLTGFQCEVDIRKDLVPKEILFDIPHLQQGSVVIYHRYAPLKNSRRRVNSPHCCPNLVL